MDGQVNTETAAKPRGCCRQTYQTMISSYVNPKFSSRWLILHSSCNTETKQKHGIHNGGFMSVL